MDPAMQRSPCGSSAFLQMLQEVVENDQKCQQDGFVNVPPIAFWTKIFAKYFLHVNNPHHDDLLFYVKKSGNSTIQSQVEVYRRESTKSPGLGDPAFDWTETVYLNLILQQLDYTLTCAICSKDDSTKPDLNIHKKVSQEVYASPSKHSMDEKGESAELCYPNIFFTVDNFTEIWTDLLLDDGKMVCVEIVANDKTKAFNSVIFLGSISHSTLIKAYDKKTKQASKWTQVMTLGLGKIANSTEFVRMKGPSGKGYAEMAIQRAHAEDLTPSQECTCGLAPGSASAASASSGCPVHAVTSARSEPALYSNEDDPDVGGGIFPVSSWTKHLGKAVAAQEVTQSLPTSPTVEEQPKDPLKTHLTYVTLPWHKIILDVLQSFEKLTHAKKPVLHKAGKSK